MADQRDILSKGLEDLDKGSLIKIIIDQAKLIEELKKQTKDLENKIKELENKIEELERSAKRPAAPFRIEDSKRKKEKKKAGARKGHKGHFRAVSGPIDVRKEVKLSSCPKCGGKVAKSKPVKQVIEELVLRPYRMELLTYKGQCVSCGQVHSTHPFQTSHAVGSAGCHLGRQATTTALLLNYRYGMSKRKVCELFTDHFKLPLSIGGLVQMQHRMADSFESEYEQLQAQVKSSEVVHVDETSWYVGAPKDWLWTFTNEEVTYYRVEENRNREVVSKVMGNNYQGVLVSDCLAVYDGVCDKQQKCYAHHLKAIAQALALEPESEYLKKWKNLLKQAMLWKNSQHHLSSEQYLTGCTKLALRASKLLKAPRPGPQEMKIGNRLEKQQDHLFTFLLEKNVEPTNNRAERSLRPAVIHRKISCGNKTRKGANTWQIMASVITSTEQQNAMPFSKKVEAAFNKRLQR
jgi:transposase